MNLWMMTLVLFAFKIADDYPNSSFNNCRFTEDSSDFDLPDEFVDDDFCVVCL